MKSMSKIVVPTALSLFLAAPVLAQNAPVGSQSSATSGPQNGQANATSESHSATSGNQSSATSESRNPGSSANDLNANQSTSHQRSVTQGTQRSGTQATYSQQPMSHDMTVAVQRRLQQDGLYHGNVDGQWGPETQAALSDFQRRNNLNATGQVDERTMETMKLSSNEVNSNTTGVTEQTRGTSTESHSSSSSKTQ